MHRTYLRELSQPKIPSKRSSEVPVRKRKPKSKAISVWSDGEFKLSIKFWKVKEALYNLKSKNTVMRNPDL